MTVNRMQGIVEQTDWNEKNNGYDENQNKKKQT